MTTSEYADTTGGDFPGHGDGGMRGHAQQTAGAAADEGRRVASVAQDELRNVASEAKYQVRGLVDQAGRQVDDQTRQQKGRLVETMNTLSRDLDGMASEREGMAAELVHEVAQRTRTLSVPAPGLGRVRRRVEPRSAVVVALISGPPMPSRFMLAP